MAFLLNARKGSTVCSAASLSASGSGSARSLGRSGVMKMAAKMQNMAMDANNQHEKLSRRGQKDSGNGHPAGQAQGVCSVSQRYQKEHFSVFLVTKWLCGHDHCCQLLTPCAQHL